MRPPTPRITDAVLELLSFCDRTPGAMTQVINEASLYRELRDRWGGKVTIKQVYAAMSGLRSKRAGRSLIEPIGGEPSTGALYRLTQLGRQELQKRRPDAPAVVDRRPEAVDHPPHYGGADNPYEAIKVIEAWKLDFCLGNTVKYISRAGQKPLEPGLPGVLGDEEERRAAATLQDLRKAQWYLTRRIQQLQKEASHG